MVGGGTMSPVTAGLTPTRTRRTENRNENDDESYLTCPFGRQERVYDWVTVAGDRRFSQGRVPVRTPAGTFFISRDK